MTAAADGEDADLVVLNTCHIREKAAEKAYSDVGRLRREDGSKPLIALAGCVAQAEGAEARRRSPMIDMVVGPQAYHRLPEMVAEAARGASAGRHRHAGDLQVRRLPSAPPRQPERLPHRAGRLRQILHLLRRALHPRRRDLAAVGATSSPRRMQLVDAGAREIVLLGQNVNAWADGDRGLAELIRALAKIDGLERIRYTTSHPADMTDALIAAHGEVDKLMPYLHLPVQSGSNRILKAMNRSHTVETYLAILEQGARRPPRHRPVRRLHRRLPRRDRRRFRSDAAISSTRSATLRPIRSNTARGRARPPQRWRTRSRREMMDDRLQRLQARINAHQLAFNRSERRARTREVLIERKGRHRGPDDRPIALAAVGACRNRRASRATWST